MRRFHDWYLHVLPTSIDLIQACFTTDTFGSPAEKNVFESLIAPLMDTGKSKDGLKSPKDMVQLNMMPQLHPVPEANGKYTLPAACFNLTPERTELYALS